MTKDHIVDEVRRIREGQAAKYGFDIQAILAAAKKRQNKSQFKVASFASKRTRAPKASKRPSTKQPVD
jgi:hypothetical protein